MDIHLQVYLLLGLVVGSIRLFSSLEGSLTVLISLSVDCGGFVD